MARSSQRPHRFCAQTVRIDQTDTWLAQQSAKELRELRDQGSDSLRRFKSGEGCYDAGQAISRSGLRRAGLHQLGLESRLRMTVLSGNSENQFADGAVNSWLLGEAVGILSRASAVCQFFCRTGSLEQRKNSCGRRRACQKRALPPCSQAPATQRTQRNFRL